MQQRSLSPEVFAAIRAGDVAELWKSPRNHLRPFLPYLVRISSSSSSACGPTWSKQRLLLLSLLAEVEEVNEVRKYLDLDFSELKHDAVKEQQLLHKLHPGESRPSESSVLATGVSSGLMVDYERSGCMRRARLVLSELLKILHQDDSSKQFQSVQLDLFECEALMDEVGDTMCIVAAELPDLLPVTVLSKALLRLKKGSYFICRLLANMPSCFDKVISFFVVNAGSQDEITLAGRRRAKAVIDLLSMCPASAPHVQWLTYTNHKLPSVMISIALSVEKQREMDELTGSEIDGSKLGGVVSLINNVIIHGDDATRLWFAQYIKNMQHKSRRQRSSAMTALRKYLMGKLVHYIKKGAGQLGAESTPTDIDMVLDPVEENGENQFETKSVTKVEDDDEEMVTVDASGEVMEEEEEMDTEKLAAATLELVGQMDIEISDQDAGGTELVSAKAEDTVAITEAPPVSSTISTSVIATATTTTLTSIESVTAAGDEGGAKKQAPGRGGHPRRRHSSVLFDSIDFPSLSLVRPFSDSVVTELMHLMRICCGLKVHAYMFLTGDETAALLRLITCTCPPFSPAGVKFVEVALCVLLACPFLISSEECEKAVVHWLQWLLDNLPSFESACPSHRCYGDMLLLVAIHLQDKQLGQIEDLITATLGMKITNLPRSAHFSILREQFLKVFTDKVVCSHAVSVSPTTCLSGHMTGYLPVHCILQLMRSKVFRKHGVSVKEWIYSQLLTTSEPLHSTLPPLIQEYVLAILLPSQSYRSAKPYPSTPSQTPFTAEEVLNVFKPRLDSGSDHQMYPISSQLLMLYYTLFYQDTFLSNLKSLLFHSGSSSLPRAYSPAVLVQVPVKRLLLHAWKHQEAYSTLYPSLLRLTISHLPHLCQVEDWLKEEEIVNSSLFVPVFRIPPEKVTVEYTNNVLHNLGPQPTKALLLLNHLSSLPASSLLPFSPVLTSTLTLLLDPSVSKRLQQLYLSLWTEVNSVAPRKLWVETVNALRPAHQSTLPRYTHQQLIEDPLIVLQCDNKVFRCPPVFEMVLRVLAAYTSASRAWLTEQAHVQNCMAAVGRDGSAGRQVSPQEREELRIALTAAQESAAIQLLLEACLPTQEDRENASIVGSQLTQLREIQCLVCSYLHQVFIADPNMAKLVHFQGYPLQLLPMTAAGIPSMHICLDFIAELLAQPHLEKQQFTIQLAAHVTQQYPLPDAVDVVKDIFKRLHVLANEIPADKRDTFFKPLLPAVTKFCQTFPPLCTEATELLLHLGRVCLVSKCDNLSLTDTHSTHDACDDIVLGDERSHDPTMSLEDQLSVVETVSLVEGVQLVFKQLVNTSLLRVATKT